MKGNPIMGLKSHFFVGLTAAVTATVIAPIVVPVVKRTARPLAKSLLKGGIMLYERNREAVAKVGEAVEDVVAEIYAEEMGKSAAMSESAADDKTRAEAGHQARAGSDKDQSQESDRTKMGFATLAKEERVG
jgi:hypothetical protein